MSMQIFLKLDGIEGESADAHHKGEIELIGWTWGLAEPAAGGSSARASGGASAGKLIVRDIAIEKHTDLASPLLMLFAAEGKPVANGVITNRRATGGEFLILKMTDILVTSAAQATTIEGESGRRDHHACVPESRSRISPDADERHACAANRIRLGPRGEPPSLTARLGK